LDEDDFTEGHELDRKWRVPKAMTGRRLSPSWNWAVRGYEGPIGAKKHLVLGSLSYIGPPQGENSVAIG